jgi:hypothetical protein
MTGHQGSCPDDQHLVDLALGELTGRQRSDVLTHLLGCRTCRHRVDDVMRISEELLLAAPEAEPPVGFETAVVDQLSTNARTPAQPSPRRWFRPAVGVAVAALLALVVVGVVAALAVTRDSSEFAEAPMVTPSGIEVGSAWRYADDPAWILVSVPGWEIWDAGTGEALTYELRIELEDGSMISSGAVDFGSNDGSWATTTTVDTDQIRSVAIVDQTGTTWCSALFEA